MLHVLQGEGAVPIVHLREEDGGIGRGAVSAEHQLNTIPVRLSTQRVHTEAVFHILQHELAVASVHRQQVRRGVAGVAVSIEDQ